MVRNLPANAGEARNIDLIPGSRRSPGIGTSNPPVFLLGKFHGQRILVGYSPWGRKKSDATEHAHTYTHTHAFLSLVILFCMKSILEKKIATHSSTLAWRIPMDREEPGGVQAMGSQNVGHD